MRRRAFIASSLGAALASSLQALAKEPARIAVLGSGSKDAPLSVDQMTWLRSGLRAAGLIEGQDFTFEARWAEGDYRHFPELAGELIEKQPAAIIVSTIAAAEAAREASKTTPIVMTGLNDPVGAGLARSLARPGGNITGMATMNEVVIFKLLGLIPSVLPHTKRITAMVNPTNPSNPVIMASLKNEAARLGFVVETVEVAAPAALDKAFEQLRRYRPDLLIVVPDNALYALSESIMSRALPERLPTMATAHMSLAGALITYGYHRREAMERTGFYLKRILDGARPADLPIEQPTKFHLTVNLKTAGLLGIEIPSAVLALADEVIE
jgi:putative tryptophan/tyrosine transport system substrate-binding protein